LPHVDVAIEPGDTNCAPAKTFARIAVFAIEKSIRAKCGSEHRAVRQENSKALVLELKTWLDNSSCAHVRICKVLDRRSHPEGLNHWNGLV
jgi:transposase